jgi:hypothetical protein
VHTYKIFFPGYCFTSRTQDGVSRTGHDDGDGVVLPEGLQKIMILLIFSAAHYSNDVDADYPIDSWIDSVPARSSNQLMTSIFFLVADLDPPCLQTKPSTNEADN